MRMIDKMGIDPNTEEGLCSLLDIKCKDIKDGYETYDTCKYPDGNFSCLKCKAERLLAEVPTKKRWETIKSDDDLSAIYNSFLEFCHGKPCPDCRYRYTTSYGHKVMCFLRYLLEEIEVEA